MPLSLRLGSLLNGPELACRDDAGKEVTVWRLRRRVATEWTPGGVGGSIPRSAAHIQTHTHNVVHQKYIKKREREIKGKKRAKGKEKEDSREWK